MGTIATVTIGSDIFSVYALTSSPVVDLTSYWNGRLGATATAVAAATTDNKARALVMAADWIDRVARFSGTPTVPGQPRAFPRNGATCYSDSVPNGTTPDEVPKAEFEIAGLMLVDPDQASASGTGSNVRGVKAGSASVEFFIPTLGNPLFDTRLPTPANDLLKCLFGGVALTNFASGTDKETGFDEEDFERTVGFR